MKVASKNLVPLAQAYALTAFEGAVTTTVSALRRPRIIHMQEVADLVWASVGTEEEIAAAWLHDVVEDTSTRLEQIRENFGSVVADIVGSLTDPPDFKDLPLSERKPRQAERLHSEGRSVKLVKIADQTSNVRQLALDPTNEMTRNTCLEYIRGAKLLADACAGASPMIDKLFLEAYRKGVERFK